MLGKPDFLPTTRQVLCSTPHLKHFLCGIRDSGLSAGTQTEIAENRNAKQKGEKSE
jgi:hypothetical protein